MHVSRFLARQQHQIFHHKVQNIRRHMLERAVTIFHPREGVQFPQPVVPLSDVMLVCYSVHDAPYRLAEPFVGWLRGYAAQWQPEERVVSWAGEQALFSYDLGRPFGPGAPRLSPAANPELARLGLFLDHFLARTYSAKCTSHGPRLPKLLYVLDPAQWEAIAKSEGVWQSLRARCKFKDRAHFDAMVPPATQQRVLLEEAKRQLRPADTRVSQDLIPLAFVPGEIDPGRIYADLSGVLGYEFFNVTRRLPAFQKLDNPAPRVLVAHGLDPENPVFEELCPVGDDTPITEMRQVFRREFGAWAYLLEDGDVDQALLHPNRPVKVSMQPVDWKQSPAMLERLLRHWLPFDISPVVSTEDLVNGAGDPGQPLRLEGMGIPTVFSHAAVSDVAGQLQYNFAEQRGQVVDLGSAPEHWLRSLGFVRPAAAPLVESSHVGPGVEAEVGAASATGGELVGSDQQPADVAALPS
jgi:hypothetical protein